MKKLMILIAALLFVAACDSDSSGPNPDTSLTVVFSGLSGDTSTVNIGYEIVGITSGSGSYTFGVDTMPTGIAYPGDSLWMYVSSGPGKTVFGSIAVNDTSVVTASDSIIVLLGYRIPE